MSNTRAATAHIGKPLTIGIAERELESFSHLWYLGGDPRMGRFRSEHDPLSARGLVVEDAAGQRAAIISVDIIGYAEFLVPGERSPSIELGRRVQHRVSIPETHVLLAATHTHASPDYTGITPIETQRRALEWMDRHLDSLADLVADAFWSRRPSSLSVYETDVDDVGANRRILLRDGRLVKRFDEPDPAEVLDWGVSDNLAQAWIFTSDQGEVQGGILRFSCHPTVVQSQPLWSSDFPGVARRLLERELGGTFLYLQGACGNIGPVCVGNGFDDAERLGKRLGQAAVAAVRQTPNAAKGVTADRLDVRSRCVMLSARGDVEPVRDDDPCEDWLKMAFGGIAWSAEWLEREKRRLARLIARYPVVPVDLWLLRIGPFPLLAISGEPFAEAALSLRDSTEGERRMIVGCAGAYAGYICPSEAYDAGGYETWPGPWNRLGRGAYEVVIGEARELLHEGSRRGGTIPFRDDKVRRG